MKKLDSLYDIDWNPRILIEASAGTGKTYTLTALYVRLLLEKKLNVDQILVMTFTNKATSELKERIFVRLKECLKRLETGLKSEDTFANDVADHIGNSADAIHHLKKTIQNFDESQIFTIHGFCQKVLKEEALLAGTPFDFEVVQQDELLMQATEDFWRLFMNRYSGSEEGRYYISKLMNIAKSPQILRDTLAVLFSKPYARFEGEGMENPLQYIKQILRVRHDIVRMWKLEREYIKKELLECDLKYYTKKNVFTRVKEMDEFVNDSSFSNDTFEKLRFFTSSHINNPDNLKSGKTRIPNHSFFNLCDEYSDLIKQIEKVKTSIISEAYNEIKKIRSKLSKDSIAVTYDDLLKKVNRAVTDSVNSEELAKTLKKKYPAVLVDEFQDTDPIQYSILNAIYPARNTDSALLMIGDPKQAIYAFRGADIYTYLHARNDASVEQYTLQKNYRSAPSFNNAVNTFFGYSNQPFIQKNIEYLKVDTGLKDLDQEFLIDDSVSSGIRVIAKTGLESNKDGANQFVFKQTVKEIAELIKKGARGEARIKNRNLEAGDIAILVSSHKSAEEIKQKLKKAGIDSVTYSREKVFESAEARRLNYLMSAVLDPYNRAAFSNALITGFWGQSLNELHKIITDSVERQQHLEELQELNDIWVNEGFYPMFRKLLFTKNRISNIARFINSERILTNLYQLADITTQAEKEGKLDPHSLLSWFEDEMADPDKDEEKTLLLESDQNLVKISTIHNSKGLEFPIVFCPTLWDAKSGNNKDYLVEYHDDDGGAIIRFDQFPNEDNEYAAYKSTLEDIAEEVRKYYVAVTRAKYLCVIPWASHTTSLQSGIISSLIGAQTVAENIRNNSNLKTSKNFTDTTLINIFRELENRSDGNITLDVIDDVETATDPVLKDVTKPTDISHKVYQGQSPIKVQRRLESFSSITNHNVNPTEPEYDQIMDSYVSILHQPVRPSEKNIFTFPRGATAGTAIHKLFEDKNFRFDTALKDDHEPIIDKVLDQYQIDIKWKSVTQHMIRNVVSAVIPNLILSKVKSDEELREMEFHFKARQPSLDKILKTIRSEESTRKDSAKDLQSIMTGFIDLIVRQNGKYFIVDYKSNYLGDTLEDYNRDQLKKEIYSASYDLQYHLYTVALIKYLKSRMYRFDYESDFGGVAYLFVRGMRKGDSNGVWFHKPKQKVIQAVANELGASL